jgi:hypothetical protein
MRNVAIFSGASNTFGLGLELEFRDKYNDDNWLKENGLLVESESRSSDMFKFRVGQHLFEGKVNKVKKMSK